MASSVSFLASLILKMNKAQALTPEEEQQLALLVAPMAATVPTTVPTTVAATATTAPKTTPVPTKVKPTAKTKVTKAPTSAASATPVLHAIEKAYTLQSINPSLCQARKVNDKDFIKGTDTYKVYAEIQCTRKKGGESDFCKFCAATEEKWRTGGGKEKKWCGRVTDPIPEHLHILGSAWFKLTYPDGLSGILEPVALPAPPTTDSVLDDTQPIQDVEWEVFNYHGTPMIRHIRDGRVYKADITKEGLDRIVLSQFQGRWENGDLNIFATLDDDDEEESS